MNLKNARKMVRAALKNYRSFLDNVTRIEKEVIGGMIEFPTDATMARVEEALQPERVAAWVKANKGRRQSIDDILMDAALALEDEQIDSDEYIDSLIFVIRRNFQGVAYLDDDDNIQIFEPEEGN